MKKPVLILLSLLVLAGCQRTAPSMLPVKALPEPSSKVADYLAVNCDAIWAMVGHSAIENPLYWLRAIDCAERLSPAAARAEAHRWPAASWDNAFKQGVLLDKGNVTPPERRAYVEQLDAFSTHYPGAVRPLLQLWRNQQAAQLDLSESRTRYHHLQQTSDTQLDQMRQQQRTLYKQLMETRHKLERLTDIERQLSTRKSADLSEHGSVRSAERMPADENETETHADQQEAQK